VRAVLALSPLRASVVVPKLADEPSQNRNPKEHPGQKTILVLGVSFGCPPIRTAGNHNHAASSGGAQVYDLLAAPGSPPLPVRHDTQRGFFVPGLAVVPLPALQHALQMVQVGTHARRVGSHQLNKVRVRALSKFFVVMVGAMPVCGFGQAVLGIECE
jgi:hypothetical protein